MITIKNLSNFLIFNNKKNKKTYKTFYTDRFKPVNIQPHKDVSALLGYKHQSGGSNDGEFIETVSMIDKNRHTVCISSQVGCALDCGFCATGNMGLKRNLKSGEIIDQIIFNTLNKELKIKKDIKKNKPIITNS